MSTPTIPTTASNNTAQSASAPVEVFRITPENAEQVAEALGLGKPLVMATAEDMVWVREDSKK